MHSWCCNMRECRHGHVTVDKRRCHVLWPAILLLIWGHLIWCISLEGDTNTETHSAVSLSPVTELKVTETHGPQGGWVGISSNKRNKSIVKRNRPSCQNTHKEAWTGKSSISTSWEIITPFWMCLWGQRGLCYDACTIYWGRGIQCSWCEPWTFAKGHAWSDIVLASFVFSCGSIVAIEAFKIQQSLMQN